MTRSVNEKVFFEDLYAKGEDPWEVFKDELRKEKFLARSKKLNEILSSLSLEGKKAIDIGCGEGLVEDQLKKKYSIMGLDISLRALQMAKAKHQMNQLIAGNSIQLPFKKNSFDLVMLLETLYYHDAEKMMEEVSRITKKNGTLILSLGNKTAFARRNFDEKVYSSKSNLEWQEKRYSMKELTRLLHNTGFRVKQTHGILLYIPAITRRSKWIRQNILFPLGGIFKNQANQLILVAEKVKD